MNAARSRASGSRSTSRSVLIGAGGQATAPSSVMAGNLSHARRTGVSDDRQRQRLLTRRPDLDVGVRTRLETVTMTVWDNLGEFFDGLARDFRGWEGERVRADNHLVVTASFRSGGHVHLSWTLRSGFFPEDWKCTVTAARPATRCSWGR
ncbi:DUF6228 family protein [Streptomyces sp. NPDC001698]|uniref:DUF6228 family protein n=1 Tax=unclassified Streptomyces TaxID=2593676 RepID=UPI0036AC083A